MLASGDLSRDSAVRITSLVPQHLTPYVSRLSQQLHDSPYRDASDRLDTALRRLVSDSTPAPPEVVADAIVAIAEDDGAGLRHQIGSDAELIWSVRR